MVSACSIIAGNYLPHVQVLADSFFARHPDGALTVLLIDDEERRLTPADHRIDWRRLADIGLDRAEIHRLAGMYDVTELATAVKPLLLRRLLDDGVREMIYLDPDIRIYGRLDEVLPLARQHDIVLTPHTLEPFPHDDRQVDALFVLAAGVYNLGFIGIGSGARRFLDWWASHTRRGALNDVTRMMFTDQRWIDFVPSLFKHHLLKDPGYNVAYWNLHGRRLTREGDGRYLVNGAPLRFFHFSGFDVREPWLLSRHQGDRPRILLSEQPVLARLCREYAEDVERVRHGGGARAGERLASSYGWQHAASGLELTTRIRRLYWRSMIEAERGHEAEPPDPFDAAHPERFVAWLNAPAASAEPGSRVSRYVQAIYEARPDLQSHFSNLAGGDFARLADWLWRDGIAQEQIPIELLPPRDDDFKPPVPAADSAATFAEGLHIAGYFRSELGIGEAARLLLRAADAAKVPCSTHTTVHTLIRQEHRFDDRPGGAQPYDINLLCINADGTPTFAHEAGPSFFAGRHTIGYWFWEVHPLPASMHSAFNIVDEVWAATDYIADIIRDKAPKPVYTVPVPIVPPMCPPHLTRAALGLPADRFVFLLLFDFLSVVQRKNPLGLIEAFMQAFAPGEGPLLVLKSTNGHLRLPQLERLRLAIADRPDVLLLDAFYRADEKNALLNACDCYVSLHRAEGLGLTMAEAMALGKPTIATGYSGNRHFMTPDNSYLIDYTLTTVPPGCGSYPAGATWADPDLDHAARVMREIHARPHDARRRGLRGQSEILARHGVATSARVIASRLEAIRRGKASAAAAAASPAAAGASVAAEPHDSDTATATTVAAAPDAVAPFAADAPMVMVGEPAAVAPTDAGLIPSVGMLDALTPQLALGRPRLEDDGRGWQGLRRFAQRALFRTLRPYWFQQGQLQDVFTGAVLDSVKGLSAQLAASNAAANAAAVAAQAREQQMETRLQQLTQTLAETQAETKQSLVSLSERVFVAQATAGRQTRYGRYVPREPEALFRARQRLYLPLLQHRTQVIDIHCGRGRMLDLLRAAQVPAMGIEPDPQLVWHCRANGHIVEQAEALPFLRGRGQSGDALDAIFSANTIQQLPFDELEEFLQLCRARLGDGGLFIAEIAPHAPTPAGAAANGRTGRDASASAVEGVGAGPGRTVRPETALALCEAAGFADAQVLFHGVESESDAEAERGGYAVAATARARG